MPSAERLYDAFISYSHAADGELAPALQRGLQRFAKPWYRARALAVFRDETSLSANPALWSSIEEALQSSRHFILLASPEAAASRWVVREVAYWLEHRLPETLLIALTDGAVVWDDGERDFDWRDTNALPGALRGVFREEPRIVDLRFARAPDLALSHPRFRDAVADLAAPLHGVPKDELSSEEVRQHRRTARLARGVVASLAGLLAVAVVLAFLAIVQRNDARAGQSEALAEQSFGVVEADPAAGLRLALEAADVAHTAEAEAALRVALSRPFPRMLDRGGSSILASSADGDTFLSSGRNGTARLWDARRGTLLRVLRGHNGEVETAAFSPDGTLVVTGGADHTARLWNAWSGENVRVLRGHRFDVDAATFSPDGREVVTGGIDATARIWNVATGRCIHVLRHLEPVRSAVFSSDGRRVLTKSEDGTAHVWDARTGHSLRVLAVSAERAGTASFSPDGTKILTDAGVDGASHLWDAATGRQRHAFPGQVSTAVFSHDGTKVLTGGQGAAELWNARSGKRIRVLETDGMVRSAVFSSDERDVITAGDDGVARVWDARTGDEVATLNARAALRTAVLNGNDEHVATAGTAGLELWNVGSGTAPRSLPGRVGVGGIAVFSPDGNRILAADEHGTITAWAATSRRQIRALHLGRDAGDVLAFSPDRSKVLAAGERSARIVDLESAQTVGSMALGGLSDYGAFSPDGREVVVPKGDGAAQVVDATTGKPLRVLASRPGGYVSGALFSPNGKLIVTQSDSGVGIWDASTGELLHLLHSFPGGALTTAFSPDGRRLLTAGDSAPRVWDVARGKTLSVLRGHPAGVETAAFSPDGEQIVTGAENDRTRLWDAATGTSVHVLGGQTAGVQTAAFSPDGKELLTAGWDGTVRIRDSASGITLQVLRDHVATERRIENGAAGFENALFAPDARHILTTSGDDPLHLWTCELCGVSFGRLRELARQRLSDR